MNLTVKNIAVNAIPQGIVEKDLLNHFSIMVRDKVLESAISLTPADRLVMPDIFTNAAFFLCSPNA